MIGYGRWKGSKLHAGVTVRNAPCLSVLLPASEAEGEVCGVPVWLFWFSLETICYAFDSFACLAVVAGTAV